MCQELGPAPAQTADLRYTSAVWLDIFILKKVQIQMVLREDSLKTLRGDKTHNQPLVVTAEINADHYD